MSKFTKSIKHIEGKIIIKKEIIHEFKKIKNKKRKKIINSIVLSQEQKQQIDELIYKIQNIGYVLLNRQMRQIQVKAVWY